MICEELKIACTVQMRRFDTLLPSLADNRGDAVMASIAVTPEARTLADFSDPYYRTPARFVARRDLALNDVRRNCSRARRSRWPPAPRTRFSSGAVHGSGRAGLRHACAGAGSVAQRRGRPVVRRRHLAGVQAERHGLAELLRLRGGPFIESRYFGEGDWHRGQNAATTHFARGFNWALFRLWEKGRFSDLWLRYFPISPF